MLSIQRRQLWSNRTTRYPGLTSNIDTGILIVGGGMTGLSAAYHLREKNIVLIESGRIGDATGKGTGILCPGLDLDFQDLVASSGFRKTVREVGSDLKALTEIKRLIREWRLNCELEERSGMAVALYENEIAPLRHEFELYKRAKRSCAWIQGVKLKKFIGAKVLAAMVTSEPALINQEKFLEELAHRLERKVHFFEHTPLTSLKRHRGRYVAKTPHGAISAKCVILAAGGEDRRFVSKHRKVKKYSCYVVATKPLPKTAWKSLGWKKIGVLWPLGKTYDFIRVTKDHRLIVGGEDAHINLSGLRRQAHFERLQVFLKTIFPQLTEVKIDHEWSGQIFETRGMVPEVGNHKGLLYGFAYGGTGLLVAFRTGEQLAKLASSK